MMPKKANLFLAAVLAVFFTTASAMADSGWYTGFNLGLNFQEDQQSIGPSRAVDLDFDTGLLISGQLGYKFPGSNFGRFRAEAELSHRENDVDEIVFNGAEQNGRGEEEVLAGLMNLYYDLNGLSDRIKPFVGVGIGFANIDAEVSYANAFIDDDDTTFAYQFVVGAEYLLSSRISVVGDARFFALDDPELTRFGGPAPVDFVDLNSEYDSFSASVGLRYNF